MAITRKDEPADQPAAVGVTTASAPDAPPPDEQPTADNGQVAPIELGPVVPEGEFRARAPEDTGPSETGVQPVEDADIPDAGR